MHVLQYVSAVCKCAAAIWIECSYLEVDFDSLLRVTIDGFDIIFILAPQVTMTVIDGY